MMGGGGGRRKSQEEGEVDFFFQPGDSNIRKPSEGDLI